MEVWPAAMFIPAFTIFDLNSAAVFNIVDYEFENISIYPGLKNTQG